MPPPIPSPDKISETDFSALLRRYDGVIQAVSDAKGAKPGQKTLAELDTYRYSTAPASFSRTSACPGTMTLDAVKTLVEWKLRHGKFRPTLMKLVSSNDPSVVDKAVKEGLAAYEAAYRAAASGPAPDRSQKLSAHAAAAMAAVKVLCKLRGIGPATASLVVAVHYPESAIFFSDEAYAWLCGGPALSPPSKYNEKEYAELARAAARLLSRLSSDTGMQTVEQAAYVLVRDRNGGNSGGNSTGNAKAAPAAPAAIKTQPTTQRTKRKEPPTEDVPAPTAPARRSSRPRRA